MPDIATTSTVVKELLEIIHKSADIYEKLRATFKGSPEAKQEAIENKNELLQFKFNKFTESFSCKSIIGITNEKFEAFVVRLQKWYDLPDKIKGSILESLHANEDEGDISDFKFVDGKGIAYYARFVTIRNGQEMDVAYAVYTLDFEFPEKQIKTTTTDYWFYFIPVTREVVTIVKDPQNLSPAEIDKFSQWCIAKLSNKFTKVDSDDNSKEVPVA